MIWSVGAVLFTYYEAPVLYLLLKDAKYSLIQVAYPSSNEHCKKIDQLPAVDMQHAPAKLPSKLHLFAYVDFLAQSLCTVHSDCTSKLGWINIVERLE